MKQNMLALGIVFGLKFYLRTVNSEHHSGLLELTPDTALSQRITWV